MSKSESTPVSRRHFLQLGMGAAGLLTLGGFTSNAFASIPEKKISLYNLHTGESVKATFWAAGQYNPDALNEINHVLRDFRSGESHMMDPRLMDHLHALQHLMASNETFHIISGYRSPATNAKLRNASEGVAKKSLHMQGKAIDIRLPGRDLSLLRKTALSMNAGGVGYYPKSDFVHIDTGRVRQWGG